MTKGLIFNIQRYSLHDGPGIRTTIFLKGCPLNCWWCQNPESISSNHDIMRQPDHCLGCGSCMEACPEEAVRVGETGPVIDRSLCNRCLKCTLVCPSEALEAVGMEYTAENLVKEALKDRVIFDNSGGGVTFSGGEPLMQPDFIEEALKSLNHEAVHTAIDTSGYTPWPILEQIAAYADLFLYDLKLINDLGSRKYTGNSSRLAIDNLKRLVEDGARIRVRMPVIPTYTDHDSNIDAVAELLIKCSIEELELIPYHNYGTAKYSRLDLEYRPGAIEIPTSEILGRIKDRFRTRGIKILSEDDLYDGRFKRHE